MGVSSLPSKSFPTQANLLIVFKSRFPDITFKPGTHFAWSPKNSTITYVKDSSNEESNAYALIHEVAHAELGHLSFSDDFGLLALEVAAWNHAKGLATSVNVAIDEDYVQDCLDTYRDWLHARATCPSCGIVSLQVNEAAYSCFNCRTSWKVPKSQACRVSRRVIT